ncbi:MAG: hypothetical protein R3Y23_01080 [Bacillota bacterium]
MTLNLDNNKKEWLINIAMMAIMALFITLTCVLENTETLLLTPIITADAFLESMPYLTFNWFGNEVVLQQLSSTIMVEGLGLAIVVVGIIIAITKRANKTGLYWGIGLVLWGLGAAVAGVSYQAFGYELKAAGQEYVLFTSNWELSYMILTAFATNYMLVGTAYATTEGKVRKNLTIFAICHSIAYGFYMLIGAVFAIEFLISYFGFVVFVAIDFIIMFYLNVTHMIKYQDKFSKNLIWAWIDFAVANIGYFICYWCSMGTKLYENYGVWFTENDVLHLLLLVWAIHFFIVLMSVVPKTPWEKEQFTPVSANKK